MFDFLAEKPEPLIPEVVHHGPNEKNMRKKNRRHIIQDVVDIYFEERPGELSGKELMRQHMQNDPKAYFDVIKKMIPNQLNLDAGEMLNVKLIDRYGNQAELAAQGRDPGSDPAHLSADLPQIEIQDRFEVDPQPGTESCSRSERTESCSRSERTATGGSPQTDFDFTL